jgi:hypothetical protein
MVTLPCRLHTVQVLLQVQYSRLSQLSGEQVVRLCQLDTLQVLRQARCSLLYQR